MVPTKEDILTVAGLITMCQQIEEKTRNLDFDMIIDIGLDGVHISWKAFNRLFGDEPFEIKNQENVVGNIVQFHSIMIGNVRVFALYKQGDEGWVEL